MDSAGDCDSGSGLGVASLRVPLVLVFLLFVINLKSLAASNSFLPFVERLQLLRCRRRDSLGSFLLTVQNIGRYLHEIVCQFSCTLTSMRPPYIRSVLNI